MAEVITKQEIEEDLDVIEPGKFKVMLINDDKTPMEFVIIVLMRIFHHSQSTAENIMLKVHNEGKACAGTYSYEVCEQKAIETTNLARENNFPLVVKVEPE